MLPWLLHGNPLPCSCLENPTDRGAWRAAAHGVTESQTRLSDQTITQGSEIHSFLSRDSSLLPLEPPSPPSTPLGHHRAPSWAPCLHSGFPLTVYFTHGGVCVYVSATLSISSHPLLHTRCPLFEEQLNCFPQQLTFPIPTNDVQVFPFLHTWKHLWLSLLVITAIQEGPVTF